MPQDLFLGFHYESNVQPKSRISTQETFKQGDDMFWTYIFK